MGIVVSGSFYVSSFRYLNAVNPFLSSQNPLVESVAEHFTPTLVEYLTDYSVLIMFAGFGALMAFKHRNDMSIFSLIIGITGVYVSATFARLLVFSSIGIILLASLGLYEVTRSIINYKASEPTHKKRRRVEGHKTSQISRSLKIIYSGIIVILVSAIGFILVLTWFSWCLYTLLIQQALPRDRIGDPVAVIKRIKLLARHDLATRADQNNRERRRRIPQAASRDAPCCRSATPSTPSSHPPSTSMRNVADTSAADLSGEVGCSMTTMS